MIMDQSVGSGKRAAARARNCRSVASHGYLVDWNHGESVQGHMGSNYAIVCAAM
jgi:hypothetical protein